MWYITLADGTDYVYGRKNPNISLDTLAHHLSHIPRFAGATKYHFSSAQHGVHTSHIVKAWGGTAKQQKAALVHDVHESLMGDIPTPFQRWLTELSGDGFDILELAKTMIDTDLLPVLGVSFPFDAETKKIVKDADRVALILEARKLFREEPQYAIASPLSEDAERIMFQRGAVDITLHEMAMPLAKWMFIYKFQELTREIEAEQTEVAH